MKRIPYKDLHDEPEDECIRQIGEKAMRHKMTVGFFVDGTMKTDEEKADRYVRKLKEQFPGIRETYRGQFTPNVILVKVAAPIN